MTQIRSQRSALGSRVQIANGGSSLVKPISDLRFLLSGLCALLFVLNVPAAAQQQTKVRKIGWLGTRPASGPESGVGVIRRELRALGWVEGRI